MVYPVAFEPIIETFLPKGSRVINAYGGPAFGGAAKERGPSAEVAGSVVVLTVLGLVATMSSLDGFGEERGNAFADGSRRWDWIAAEEGNAAAGEVWQGAAARAYGAQDSDLRQFAADLATADTRMRHLLYEHAEHVFVVRRAMESAEAVLVAALAVALLLETAGHYVLSMVIALSVCAPLLSACIGQQSYLCAFSKQTAARVDAVRNIYHWVASQAEADVGDRMSATVRSGPTASRGLTPASDGPPGRVDSAVPWRSSVARKSASAPRVAGLRRSAAVTALGAPNGLGDVSVVPVPPESGGGGRLVGVGRPARGDRTVGQIAQRHGAAHGPAAAPGKAVTDSGCTGAASGAAGAERAPLETVAAAAVVAEPGGPAFPAGPSQ